MKTYSITDTGILREMNQDYFFASDEPVGNLPNLYIVADGMGGHKAGDYASRYTTQRIVASVSPEFGRRTSYNFKRGSLYNNVQNFYYDDHKSVLPNHSFLYITTHQPTDTVY